ncbi:MAG: tetratricopeptide repeat protein [Candidatus Krumholzibacteriia bacterium]|nr:tetratricopeptide repeat protein [bacterium]MCB9514395.1 tetratricopeptide repeat protein [Candidatus Latescibacterota bacterium]MCB9516668.1 tetratricopeptide repeat protein [Candidatus Latescibacterota bacterium]
MKTVQRAILGALALLLSAAPLLAQPSDVDQLVASGGEYYRNGMYRQAVADFRQAFNADKTNLDAAKGLGSAAMQLQDWRNAKTGYEAAHELSPGDCAVTNSLAYVYLALKLEERAKQTYEEVVGKGGKPGCEPGNSFAKVNLATLYMRSRNEAEKNLALQLLNQVTNTETEDTSLLARAHYALGTLYRQKKNYDLAIDNLEKAYSYDPDKMEGRYNLGLLYFNRQQYDKALEHLQKAYAEQPNDYNLNLMLGLVYNETPGGKSDAQEYLQHAVNLIGTMKAEDRPKDNLPHRWLGNILNDEGDPSQAISVVDAGLKLTSDGTERAGLLCTKAKAYEKLGRYEDALDIFESVTGDPQWGSYAQTEIKRQENLIQRAAAGQN